MRAAFIVLSRISFVFYSKSQSNCNLRQFTCLAFRETQYRIQNTEKSFARSAPKLSVVLWRNWGGCGQSVRTRELAHDFLSFRFELYFSRGHLILLVDAYIRIPSMFRLTLILFSSFNSDLRERRSRNPGKTEKDWRGISTTCR